MSIVWTQCPDNRAWNKTADVRELVLVGDKCDNPVDFTEMLLWRFIGSFLVRRISGLLRVRKQLRKFRLKELFGFSHASRIRQYFTVYKSRNEHKNWRFIDVTVGLKKVWPFLVTLGLIQMKDFSKVPYLPLFDSRSKEGLKCPLFGVFTVRSIQYAKITHIVRVKPLQNCQLF